MTKTDKTYFNKLKNDLLSDLFNYELNNLSVADYEQFKGLGKKWHEAISPFFDKVIHNYGDLGLITRDECFRELLRVYDDLKSSIDRVHKAA